MQLKFKKIKVKVAQAINRCFWYPIIFLEIAVNLRINSLMRIYKIIEIIYLFEN